MPTPNQGVAGSISEISGFFYKIGSKDYPYSYSQDKPFGFNLGGPSNDVPDIDNPVFGYSVNDIEKSFIECWSIQKEGILKETIGVNNENGALKQTGTGVSVLMSEASGDQRKVIKQAVTIDILDKTTGHVIPNRWTSVFKVIEFCYANQTQITQDPDENKDGFTNNGVDKFQTWGDQRLSQNPNNQNPYYEAYYTKKSLRFEKGGSGRLNWVSFTMNFSKGGGGGTGNDLSKLSSIVTFKIYFSPDTWIQHVSTVEYKVYKYDDLTNDNIIDSNEMDKQVVGKLFDILKEGKYKFYNQYILNRHDPSGNITQEQYFIFSSIWQQPPNKDQILVEKIKEILRKYLLKHSGLPLQELRKRYPDLFTQSEIFIVPIYENTIQRINGNVQVAHPIPMRVIENLLNALGQPISAKNTANIRPVELFYLGPGREWNNAGGMTSSGFSHMYPILAIDMGENGTGLGGGNSSILSDRPISYRFNDYHPIYGTKESDKVGEFHYILIKALNVLAGVDIAFTQSEKDAYSIKLNEPEKKTLMRKSLQFEFAHETWIVFGRTI